MLSTAIMIPVPDVNSYITCPRCSSQVIARSNFCNFCGASLKPQPIVLKICPNCYSRITEKAHFCPECGEKQK
ncbi:zinc-ribbon domain-containing protein [Candidatus Bathyarchaeota archaeon]|nr:zinc-ribbon domain-containing protein [Candidatus Bathyarchaeota archaeon]